MTEQSSEPPTYARIVGVRSPYARTDLTVVLDIDECLLHTMPPGTSKLLETINSDSSYMELRSRTYQMKLYDLGGLKGQGKTEVHWGVLRPHLRQFMMFLFSYCRTVCFWSAGQRDYVNECVSIICKGMRTPYIVMNWDDVQVEPDEKYHKPLRKVVALDPTNIKMERILLIDDKRDNAPDNPYNFVLIPRYVPTNAIASMMQDDVALLQIRQWLLSPEVMSAKDVRDLDKSKIFVQPLHQVAPQASTVFLADGVPMYRTPLNLYELPDISKTGLVGVTVAV